jgi:hypothetical protein
MFSALGGFLEGCEAVEDVVGENDVRGIGVVLDGIPVQKRGQFFAKGTRMGGVWGHAKKNPCRVGAWELLKLVRRS